LVSTAGAHCRSDPPFNLKSPIGDPTYREIPKNADLRDILLSHIEKKRARVRPRDHSAFWLLTSGFRNGQRHGSLEWAQAGWAAGMASLEGKSIDGMKTMQRRRWVWKN